MTEPLKLAAKLAKARMKLGSLQPDKTNTDQKYNYISADKILERCGDVLAECGVVIYPSVLDVALTQVERQGKNPRLDAVLKMSFLVTDGDTESVAYWTGCGSDYMTPDKAIYKAITSGHKYFLMKLLNVGVGNEDGEHENSEPETPRPTHPVKPTQPKPAPIEYPEPAPVTEEEYFKAYEVLDSKNQKYGEKESALLSHIANNEKTPDDKKQAAVTILRYRFAHNEPSAE